MKKATILIGGDVFPSGRTIAYFRKGDVKAIFNDLLSEFEAADLRLINLESPLTDIKNSIRKVGPNLMASSDCINAIRNACIDFVNLANNHILDQGLEGLYNTISLCKREGIGYLGAGRDLEEASQMHIANINGISVGILSYTEHQFSIATEDGPGANPIDLINFIRQIRNRRNEYDFLIVLLHAGKGGYNYPPPYLQRFARFMIEEGAKIVICQHSHCPIGYEYYGGGQIHYGQGNLIFDVPHEENGLWYKGYLLKLIFKEDASFSTEIIPYLQSGHLAGARKMSRDDEKSFLAYLAEESEKVRDPSIVGRKWNEYCEKNKYIYLGMLKGYGRLLRFLNRKFHFSDLFYSENSLLSLQNLSQSETLSEIVRTILKNNVNSGRSHNS